MLELRFKTGDSEALNYSYLVRGGFNGNVVIRLQFSTCVVH